MPVVSMKARMDHAFNKRYGESLFNVFDDLSCADSLILWTRRG